jgi:hypothetical protein
MGTATNNLTTRFSLSGCGLASTGNRPGSSGAGAVAGAGFAVVVTTGVSSASVMIRAETASVVDT